MRRSSPISKEQFENNWKQVKYQLELEGLNPTEADKEVMRKVAMGEMPMQSGCFCPPPRKGKPNDKQLFVA